MDESQVMQLLFEDISRLELPPISEKVLIAIHKKKQEISKNSLIHPATEKEHKSTPTKYLFAAVLTLLTVSVPIIVVLSNKTPVSNSQNIPGLSNNKETVSIAESRIAPSTTENENALEYIKFKHVYGEVVLSDRSEKEFETLLVTYSKKSHVYEDDQYIYNFDFRGKMIEMCRLTCKENTNSSVNNQKILNKIKKLLQDYYTDWKDYDIEIHENIDVHPAWYAFVTRNNSKLSQEKITMTFEKTGQLLRISYDGSTENIGIISKAEAIEIILKELISKKYSILKFDNNEVDIIVNNKRIDNKLYYEVNVDKIPYDMVNGEICCARYSFLVDSHTGTFSIVDYSL